MRTFSQQKPRIFPPNIVEPSGLAMAHDMKFELLISTFNAADLAIIKSVLDNEEIEYQVQGEFFNMAEPLVQPARVFVPADEKDRARKALEPLKLTYLGVSFRNDAT
jgi:hypothetical protein